MATVKTNAGKAITSARMIGTSPSQAEPKYIGVGTGAGTATATDTSLFTESGSTRITGTTSQQTTTVTSDTYRVAGTYTATGAITITNVGTFDNATVASGSINIKGDLASSVALTSGDQVAFTIDEKFA